MTASHRHNRSAVTRLELACAVVVLLVVVALGHSAYRTHAARAQVAEGLAAANGLAPFIARAFQRERELPRDDALMPAVDLATRSLPFIGSISIDHGRIDIWFGDTADPAIAGQRLSLTPYETASLEVVWICGNGAALIGLKPLGFAGGTQRAAPLATTVDARYLPRQCD